MTATSASEPYPLTFSQDGRFLSLGSTVWKTPAASFRDPTQPVLTYSSTASECSPETPYRFTGDSSQLVCLGADGTVRALGVGSITAPPAASEKWSTYTRSVVSQDRTTVALVKHVVDADPLASDVTEVRAVASTDRRRTFAIQPQRIQLSPDGRLLAAWQGGGIHLYDTGSPGSPQQGELPNYDPARYAAAFSPDGRFMAVEGVEVAGPGPGYATTLDYWDLHTMRKIHTLVGKITTSMPDPGVFFAPDGQSVTAAPYFGRVSFPGGNVLVPSPSDLQANERSSSGTSLFAYPTATQPYLRTWNARTLEPQGESLRVGTVSPADPNHDSAAASAVSPDATLYAAVQGSGSAFQVKLWNLTDRNLVGVAINGIVNHIVALSFSPDGSRLTAIDEYGAAYTVPIGKAATAQAVCAEVGQLSREQWAEYVPGLPYRPTCPPGR